MDALRRTAVQIPGYYFDEKQNRYFKIEKDSNVHAEHKHSASVVQQAKRRKVHRAARILRTEAKKSTQLLQPIKRNRLLNSTLSGTRLLMSTNPGTMVNQYQKLARGYLELFPSGCALGHQSIHTDTPRCMVRLGEDFRRKGVSISSFGWDETSKALFYALQVPDGVDPESKYSTHICLNFYNKTPSPFFPLKPPILQHRYSVEHEPEPDQLERFTTRLGLVDAKIYIKPGECVSVMGFRDRWSKHGQMIVKTYGSLYHPDMDSSNENYLSSNFWLREKRITGDYGTLAWNPSSNSVNPHFAFGSSNSVFEFDATVSGFPRNSSPNDYRLGWTGSTVKSMEYLFPNVLAAGLQNSGVILFDRRAKCSNGVVRLKHSDPVNHLAKTDESGQALIVVGLGKMSLYDLRMTKGTPNCTANAFEARGHRMQRTRPVFNCRYRNQLSNHAGFSISRQHKVAAVAQEDGTFNIYSTQSGAVLKTFCQLNPKPDPIHRNAEARYPGSGNPVITQLQIIDDPSSAFRVLALQKGAIWNYGPEDTTDNDSEAVVKTLRL
jgi:hypothetical protein